MPAASRAHLLRTDTNETVRVRTDLFRGADDLHAALRLMEAIARTNPRVARSFVHVVISPHHEMTDAELAEALAMVEAEHGLSSVLRAVVEHLKGAARHPCSCRLSRRGPRNRHGRAQPR